VKLRSVLKIRRRGRGPNRKTFLICNCKMLTRSAKSTGDRSAFIARNLTISVILNELDSMRVRLQSIRRKIKNSRSS
jgi:hypothetical protein